MRRPSLHREPESRLGAIPRHVIVRVAVIVAVVLTGVFLTTSAAARSGHSKAPTPLRPAPASLLRERPAAGSSTDSAASATTPTDRIPSIGSPQLISSTDVPDPGVVWDDTPGHHGYVVFSTESSPSNFIPEYTITQANGRWSSLLPAGGLTRANAGDWVAPGAIGIAPGVIPLADGTWALYFDAQPAGGPQGDNCIGMATAPTSTGPWIAAPGLQGYPLWAEDGSASNPSGGHFPANASAAIDPQPFRDESGQLWLLWKRNDLSGDRTSIQAFKLDPTGSVVQGAPVALLAPSPGWQSAGQSVVEAPDMIYRDGTYYLFYSGGYWGTDTYGEGYAICPLVPGGPCIDEAASSPLIATGTGNGQSLIGPGGGSVFEDGGGQLWMAFHGWNGSCSLSFPHSYYECGQSRQLYFARLQP